MKTARLLILLLPLLSAVLFCQAKRMGSQEGVGLSFLSYFGKNYSYDYDDYKTYIHPYFVRNDSILFAYRLQGIHDVKDLYIPFIDIIVDKELSDIILADNPNVKLSEESDDIGLDLFQLYIMENNYSYIFNGISDGWAKKVREVAPHGYISKKSWSRNSVDGISPKVEFYNASKKTIKYITFYYTFENAVGDPCYGLSGNKMIPFKCMGPIEEGCTGSWRARDPVDYVANADTGKIVKCKIEYMDGTSYVLIKELVFGN